MSDNPTLKDVAWKALNTAMGIAVPVLAAWVWNVNAQLIKMEAVQAAQDEKVEVMYKVIVLDKLRTP